MRGGIHRIPRRGCGLCGAAIALLAIACSGGGSDGKAPTSPSTPSTPNPPVTPVAASLQVQAIASTVLSGAVLSPQPVVRILDASGALVSTGSNASLLVTASRASGAGTLGGTTSVTAVAGVATFTNLSLTGSGAHTLAFATASPALNVTSTAIDVTTPPPPPPASTIIVNVGAAATASVAAGQQVTIPIVVDMTNRGTANLASLTVNLAWDAARFSYVGNTAGNWTDAGGNAATVIVNTSSTQQGTLPITGFTVRGTTASFTLRTVTLSAIGAGPTTVSATVPAAGNEAGGSVAVTPRNLSVTITP